MRLTLLRTLPALAVLLLVSHFAIAQDASYSVTPFDAPFPDAYNTILSGVNNRGLVVGTYRDASARTRGFMYVDGRFHPIDVAAAFDTAPHAVNDRGDIVGTYHNEASWTSAHGFIYRGGVFQTLDFPGAPYTELMGINNRGDVVGFIWGLGDGLFYAFIYADNTFTPLAAPGARLTAARGINDRGEIVGWYQDYGLRPNGFIYSHGKFTMLGVPGAWGTVPGGINNHGHVAGLFYTDEPPPANVSIHFGHAFVYVDGVFTRLDGPDASYTEAQGINDTGTAVGQYFDSDGGRHGFVAVPRTPWRPISH